jgi:beta-glucosidase
MKKYMFFFLSVLAVSPAFNQSSSNYTQKVHDLVQQMTLEEKVGQMTQVTMALIAKGGWGNQDGALDPALLKKAVIDYKVGSLLNTTAHALPVDVWNNVIKEVQDEAKKTRLKIPVIYGLDAMHGQTYTLNSTLFPHNLAMAATRNPEMVRNAAKVTAKELRASGVRWNFAPVLDIGRQPLWSRFPETYGEDVYLTGFH